jgi:hypothetical protein
VAYGARLESALGASPRGFESPILRSRKSPSTHRWGFFVLAVTAVTSQNLEVIRKNSVSRGKDALH